MLKEMVADEQMPSSPQGTRRSGKRMSSTEPTIHCKVSTRAEQENLEVQMPVRGLKH